MRGQPPSGTRHCRTFALSLAVAALAALPSAPAAAQVKPHAGMLRYPDVGRTHIVFSYANDLWLAPRDGGPAALLASPPGQELFPKFSPDDSSIAFVGSYDGNRDLYVVPTAGGPPTRVTHHPAGEALCDWTPDGKLLIASNAIAPMPRMLQLLTVSPAGGLPATLPVPYGHNGAISADGAWLAYTPHSIDTRTWKRYRGGMATDVWLFNLKSGESRRITDWEGLDSIPMWHDKTVYYLSDAGPEHRLNIWSFDTAAGKREQVTKFSDFDVKWPSIGPGPAGKGEIVFQKGPELHLLDLGTKQSRAVEVVVPGARPKLREMPVAASKFISGADLSATGRRAAFEARGDVWTAPALHGNPRNLTRTSGVAERDPAWSPDGQWIAYLSDATGEYELYVTQSDGQGETRQLTRGGKAFRYRPTWSPNSKLIAFTDKTGGLFLHNMESGETKQADRDEWSEIGRVHWSSDSRWFTYGKSVDNRQRAVWIYSVDDGKPHQVTSGLFQDSWPTFDRKGDYLFFITGRNFTSPVYEDVGNSFVYSDIDMMACVPLRADVEPPFAPKSDEELFGDKKKEAEKKAKDKEGKDADKKDGTEGDQSDASTSGKAKDDQAADGAAASHAARTDSASAASKPDDKKDEPKPVRIDLDGFEQRAVLLPIKRGNLMYLNVNDEGKLIYVRNAPRGSDGKPSIKYFDLDAEKNEKKEEKTIVDEVGELRMSADGKKLLVSKEEKFAVIDAKPDQKLEKPIKLEAMSASVDPRAEWRQMFLEAWRIERDFFYDPNMHGLDWEAVRKQYEQMLADCSSREDVGYVISEMISEMNVGHAYYFGGDVESPATVNIGLLGADFELDRGAYRIKRILGGGPWDLDARSPLARADLKVKPGQYLLAVNGMPVDAKKDPWAAFVGIGGVVTLTLCDSPTRDATARDITVELAGSEVELRYRTWVEDKRRYVEEKTGGKVGYVHVPDTGVNGQNNLFRQFYGQIDKPALIIDERWNGGGQIPTRFIELLNRPITNYWARRDGKDWPWPNDAHQGPKCMLINGLSGSGGDCFPWYFRQSKLGKLIGTRTWGGLVGISGNPGLIDGAAVTAPTFAFYEKDGTWAVEGHGVDPDMQVIDDPAKMTNGGDPQLDAAIALMLDEIKQHPYQAPKRPSYPDRRGMGIREEDK